MVSEILNCYNTGTVASSAGAYNMAGILGGFERNSTANQLTIKNCYNSGAVTSTGTSAPSYSLIYYFCGGILGNVYTAGDDGSNVYTILKNCYNSGAVTGKYNYYGALIGMKCGYMTVGTSFEKCYYLSGTTHYGYNVTNQTGYLESVATFSASCMPSVLSVVGSGFKEDTGNINDGNPILSWQ